jgi:hypothetical protein
MKEERSEFRGALTFCAICKHPFTQTNRTNTRMYCTPACAYTARCIRDREGRIRRGEQLPDSKRARAL